MKITFALILLFAGLNAKAQKPGNTGQMLSTTVDTTTVMGRFQKALLGKIKYTGLAVENEHHGKLTALFVINKDRKIRYIKILKSPHDMVSESVIKALIEVEYPKTLKQGQSYIQPINFEILYVRYAYSDHTAIPVPLPDSIQAKRNFFPAVSAISTMAYNPGGIKFPKAKTILLGEITKYGSRGYGIHSME